MADIYGQCKLGDAPQLDSHPVTFKVTLNEYFKWFLDIVDQYACICDTVLSHLTNLLLCLHDLAVKFGSPFECVISLSRFLSTLLLALITLLLTGVIQVLTLPGNFFLTLLNAHPLMPPVIGLFLAFTLVLSVVVMRQIPVDIVLRQMWREYARVLVRTIGSLLMLVAWPHYCALIIIAHVCVWPIRTLCRALHTLSTTLIRWTPSRPRWNEVCTVIASTSIEEQSDERLLCCVCFMREKCILLRPCNHICLCEYCMYELYSSELMHCPLCRCRISSYDIVYI